MTVNNLGQIALALDSSGTIYAATLISGLSYGALWSLVPCIVMDLFGRKNYGTNYNLFAVAPALGSVLVSVVLAAGVYHEHTPKGKTCCIGKACYEATFLTAAGVAAIGVVLTIVLSLRSNVFYFGTFLE